jgi:hypothetical protein
MPAARGPEFLVITLIAAALAVWGARVWMNTRATAP